MYVMSYEIQEQSGAVEACWAHNPEVRGSKPRSAKNFTFKIAYLKLKHLQGFYFSLKNSLKHIKKTLNWEMDSYDLELI